MLESVSGHEQPIGRRDQTLTLRVALGMVGVVLLALVGVYLAYALGAGYLPALALPNPWNAVAALGVLSIVIYLLRRWTRQLLG